MSDAKALQDVVAKALANWGNGKAQDAFETLMGRLERAEADNAALLELVKDVPALLQEVAEGCMRRGIGMEFEPSPALTKAINNPHPGAALLEELEELEGLRRQVELQNAVISGLQDGIEKGKAAAHNAALEEAAKRADKEAEYSRSGRLQASQWGQRDVATKYEGRIVAAEGISKAIRALKTGQGA